MENIVLTVHLLLAVALIALVLLQRSEGGGLGMGGGGGGGGVMTGRQAANAMTRLTWGLAVAFLVTSMALTIIATRNSSTGSVIDQLGLSVPASSSSTGTIPAIPTLPQPADGQPLTPPAPQSVPATAADVPADAAPATPAPADAASDD